MYTLKELIMSKILAPDGLIKRIYVEILVEKGLAEQKDLEYIVLNCDSIKARKEALKFITDPALLKMIADNDKLPEDIRRDADSLYRELESKTSKKSESSEQSETIVPKKESVATPKVTTQEVAVTEHVTTPKVTTQEVAVAEQVATPKVTTQEEKLPSTKRNISCIGEKIKRVSRTFARNPNVTRRSVRLADTVKRSRLYEIGYCQRGHEMWSDYHDYVYDNSFARPRRKKYK